MRLHLRSGSAEWAQSQFVREKKMHLADESAIGIGSLKLLQHPTQRIQMQLKTILNRCYRLKRFVYGKARFKGDRILIDVQPRKNGTYQIIGIHFCVAKADAVQNLTGVA